MPVVSVRIDERVRRVLEEAGVNIGEEVKRFLYDLAWKIEVRRKVKRFSEIVESIKPAGPGYSVKSVREDREGN